MPDAYVRGMVVIVDLDPAEGSEQRGRRRPCVVIQNDIGNETSPVTIIAAITSFKEQPELFDVNVIVSKGDGGLDEDSVILCNQVRTVDRSRIKKICGKLNHDTMQKVDQALRISLALVPGLERRKLDTTIRSKL
jgi:mRNA interferase MazF